MGWTTILDRRQEMASNDSLKVDRDHHPVVRGGAGQAIRIQREVTELWSKTMQRNNVELEIQRTFYVVADLCSEDKEVPQAIVRDMLGSVDSTTSRNIAQLSIGATVGVHAPKLIESRVDPMYRRRKLIKLTAAGKRFIEAMEAIHAKG